MARRADEGDADFLTGAGQVGVFAQKPIAGMDGVYVVIQRNLDDAVNIQIPSQRRFLHAYHIGLIRTGTMQTVDILFRIYRNGFQAQVITGPKHTNRNLSPVRN